MSIFLEPCDNRDEGRRRKGTANQESIGDSVDELLVFGYACKLFRDDDKALLENSGQLLIPWMGDSSLMIDRYDLRNRLEDKGQFGLKPILPRRKTQEEEELEEMLDKERYLAMGVDISEHELLEEEGRKRQREEGGGYTAVGFSYGGENTQPERETNTSQSIPPQPTLPEHPPSTTVDVAESELEIFIPPPELHIPGHIQQPVTKKLHSIIEKTAGFVVRQGTQMEIMIKAKQKHNPLFSFLSLYDPLHPYYQLLLQLISSGRFTPASDGETTERGVEDGGGGGGGGGVGGREGEIKPVEKETKENDEEPSDSENEDSDDEGFELHPLLRVSTTPRSSPRPSGTKTTTSMTQTNHTQPLTSTPTVTMATASFVTKSLSVNAAPSLDHQNQVRGGDWEIAQDCSPHPSLLSNSMPVETLHDSRHITHFQTTPNDGRSLHPQPSDFTSQSSLEAYYHRVREEHLQNRVTSTITPHPPLPGGRRDPGPPPPPPDIQPIVDKTAEYVARNSEEFERTVLERHCGDPKFGFLNPWNQYYPYYKFRLQLNKERVAKEGLAAMERDLKQRREASRAKDVQKLNQSGAVSFKLQPKKKAVLLEVEGVDLGPTELDEEEEEEQSDSNGLDVAQQSQEGYGAQREERYKVVYQTDEEDGTVYYGHQVHYSADGTVYSEDSTLKQEGGGELAPPTKRAKTIDDDTSERVMDNKVQEFLSQVKAVLDT